MKVRIQQLDGRLPNLALMRLAAYHESLGNEITFGQGEETHNLFEPTPDQVFASTIFQYSASSTERFRQQYPDAIIGGTGLLTPERYGNMDEAVAGKYKVCISQGFNARLINERIATAIASIDYRDADFKKKRLYTAWDSIEDSAKFHRGINHLVEAGIKPKHLMVYMLIGYAPGETWGDLFERFNGLLALGVLPYPMVYNQKNKILRRFQNWVTGGWYRFTDYTVDPALSNLKMTDLTNPIMA